MRTDKIEAVGIDEDGSLWIKPATETFPHIYREGMGVHWDSARQHLYSPKPREWSYLKWYTRIRDAAREQGVNLELQQTTSWTGVKPELQNLILNDRTS